MTSKRKPFVSVVAPALALAAFVVIGTVLRLPQTTYGLPFARFADGAKTADVARRLADDWRQGRPSVDPKTYQYPTLYINALAVLCAAAGPARDPEELGRALSGLFSLLIVFPIFFLGRRLGGTAAGIAGVSLAAFGYLFVFQGRHPAPDSLQAFLTAVGFYFLLRKLYPDQRDWALSGFFIGLAAGTKYTALIFALPAAAMRLRNSGAKFWDGAARWSLAAAAGFLAATPSFLFRAPEYLERMALEARIQRSGAVGAPWGIFDFLFSSDVRPPFGPFADSIAGAMGYGFAAIGLILPLWTAFARRADPRVRTLSVACIFSYIYFALSSRIHTVRFLLPWAVLVIMLLTAELARIAKAAPRGLGKWLSAAAFIALLTPGVVKSARYTAMMRNPDTRHQAGLWILAHVHPNERMLGLMHGPAVPLGRPLVQWKFPEYRFQLGTFPPPSARRLEAEKIRWVVWNDHYTARFQTFESQGAEGDYARAWRDFEAYLRESGVARSRFKAPSQPLSPEIEIFEITRG
jgi:4-amino-4-deoxy-L-arabinose transferase-like glycosyltransferase